MPAQLTLKIPAKRSRKDSVFKREGSRFLQVRFYAGDKCYRRSSGSILKAAAYDIIPLYRRQLERDALKVAERESNKLNSYELL